MPTFRLKKAQSLGALAAENDALLGTAFVDAGYVDALKDTSDQRFLVLGRTGSGKTALLKTISSSEKVGSIDPEELSMQHLHNSTIIPKLVAAGVNLDVFYKYLWRHVCVLELIRIRYADEDDVPETVSRLFDLRMIVSAERRQKAKREREQHQREQEARESAKAYLEQYGAEYWIRTDTRIKTITNELEEKLEQNDRIGTKIGIATSQLSLEVNRHGETRETVRVEKEVVERAQNIVSDFLLSDLNKVITLLGEHGFSDPQRHVYLLIDDLDKDWMPNSSMYLGLVKALLNTVRDLNRRVPGAKAIVALRDDVFARVIAATGTVEPQREKWLDVTLPVRWNDGNLVELVNRRLAVVARHEYTNDPPVFTDMLPQKRAKRHENPEKYILDRTLLRPRDLLDFLNTCTKIDGNLQTFTWRTIHQAEAEYSERRLLALYDEWRGTYGNLKVMVDHVRRLGRYWHVNALSDVVIDDLLTDVGVEESVWLKGIREKRMAGVSGEQIRHDLVKVLIEIGFVIFRDADTHRAHVPGDNLAGIGADQLHDTQVMVHKMFWAALGLFGEESDESGPGDDARIGQ